MEEGLSAALLVRVALGVVHKVADEPEQEAWARLGHLVANPDQRRLQLIPPAQQELLDFEASPTSPARAEALMRALEQRARRDAQFGRDLHAWAQDVRQLSYTHDHGNRLRSASLHGSVVQSSPDAFVTFAIYGPQAPSDHS